MNTSTHTLVITKHAERQIATKGFSVEDVRTAYRFPGVVYESRNHPGQHRVIGNGLCLVGIFEDGVFRLITVYQNVTKTALRPDQK